MARRQGFELPEPQGISRIVDYLREENWDDLRQFLATFVIASPFLQGKSVQEKLKQVLKSKQLIGERRKIRDELLALLLDRTR